MTWLLLDALPRPVQWPQGRIEAIRHRPGNIQGFLDACGSGRTWEGVMVAGNEDVVGEVVRAIRTAFAQDSGRLLASTHFCLLPGTPGTAPLDDPRSFIERMAAQGVRVVRLPGRDSDGIRDAIVGITSGTAPMGAEADVPDYYTLLGLPETGSAAELASAIDNYRTFWNGRVDHPTLHNDAVAALAMLKHAEAELLDPITRKAYDDRLSIARERAGNRLVVPKVQPVSLQRPPESFAGHGWSKTAGVGSRTDRLDKMAARHEIELRANEKPDPDAPLEGFEDGNLPPSFHLPGLGFRWRSKDHEDTWPPVETPEGWIPLDDPVLIENAIRYGGMTPIPQSKPKAAQPPAELDEVLQALEVLEATTDPAAEPAPPPLPSPEVLPAAPPRPRPHLAQPPPPPPEPEPEPTFPSVDSIFDIPAGSVPDSGQAPEGEAAPAFVILPIPDTPVFVLEAAQLEVLDMLEEPEDLLERFLSGEIPFPTVEELLPESLRNRSSADPQDDAIEEADEPFVADDPFAVDEEEDRLALDERAAPGTTGDEPAPLADETMEGVSEDAFGDEPEEQLLETLNRMEQDPELDALFKRYGTGPLDPSVVAPSATAVPETEHPAEEAWDDPMSDVSALRAILGSAPEDVLNTARATEPELVRYSIEAADGIEGPGHGTDSRAAGEPSGQNDAPLVPLPESALSRFLGLEMLHPDHRISVPVDVAWPAEGEAALLGDCAWGPEGQSVHRITAVVPVTRLNPDDLERLKELGLIGWMIPGSLRQAGRRLDALDPLPHDAPVPSGPAMAYPGLDDDQDELLMKLLAEEGYEGPIEAAPAQRGLLEDDEDAAEGRALLENADLDDDEDTTAHGNMAVRRGAGDRGPRAVAQGRKDPSWWHQPLSWWRTREVRRQRDQAMSLLPALVPQGHRPLVLAYDPVRGRGRFALKTARQLEPLTPVLHVPGLERAMDHLTPMKRVLHRTSGTLAGLATGMVLLLGPSATDLIRESLPAWPEPKAERLEVQLAEAPAGTLLSWKQDLDQVIVLRSVDSDQDAHWVMVGNIATPGKRYLVDPWPVEHPGRYRYLVGGVHWTRPWTPWANKEVVDRNRPFRTWLSDVLKHHEH
ncbi:MAG: hypothetical protein VKO64_10220 [Candidatus Sericytochromatia bacterium]|nr:hypothetical protein [Candidatus Sericytochromatia bacterium]